MTRIACLFPGQGSQFIGMGQELYRTFGEAKEIFQIIDDTLSQHLSRLMFTGDETDLTLTRNAQPAIMAVSMAVVHVLIKQSGRTIDELCQVMAGHSLGEYSAFCATGTFTVQDCAKLLRTRGDLMQNAVPVGKGGMVALIGADIQAAEAIAQAAGEYGVCQIANDNGAGQIVMSGEIKPMEKLLEIYGQYNIKRAIKLPVSAPFHSTLMDTAATGMEKALQNIAMHVPAVPVIHNVTAELNDGVDAIRSMLTRQVAGKVRWREGMEVIENAYNPDIYLEIGPGKVLTTIAKRMYKSAHTFSIHTPAEIEEFMNVIL